MSRIVETLTGKGIIIYGINGMPLARWRALTPKQKKEVRRRMKRRAGNQGPAKK